MTPLLTLLFGFSPATAVGTDLAFASITKGFGTIAHRAHGHVQWQVVRRLPHGQPARRTGRHPRTPERRRAGRAGCTAFG